MRRNFVLTTTILLATLLPCLASSTDAKKTLKTAQDLYSQTLAAEQKKSADAREALQNTLKEIEALPPEAPKREGLIKKASILDQQIKTHTFHLRLVTREAKSLAEELRSELLTIARLENEVQQWENQTAFHEAKIQKLQPPPETAPSPQLKTHQNRLIQAHSQLKLLQKALQNKNSTVAQLATELQKTLEPYSHPAPSKTPPNPKKTLKPQQGAP